MNFAKYIVVLREFLIFWQNLKIIRETNNE